MTNKHTKKALLSSALALILCFSMLVGTTFAWFTDSVTSGNNVIQSGNLDISMQHARWNGAGYDAWEDVANSTGLFLNQEGNSILWEPEAEAQERFKIVNEGTLALKYQFKLGYTNATVAPNGNTLADVLEVTSVAWGNTDAVKEGDTKVALLKDYVFEAYLLPEESLEFEVMIKWNQSANDNDYNIAGGMKIDMGVCLLATQHTYEVDVEDNQYDKDATLPNIVMNHAELDEALKDGKDVTLGEDIQDAPAANSNGHGATGYNVNGGVLDGNGHSVGVNAYGTWDSAICAYGGTIKNLTVNEGFRGIFVKKNTEKVTLENVVVNGSVYTISCDEGGNGGLKATNCEFYGWTSYAKTIGNVEFVNCTFGAGSGYNFSRPYASTSYVGCEFNAGHRIDARAEITFENCTIDGVALTDANLATLVTSHVENATVK